MPIRTATVKKKISANGQALHRMMMRQEKSGVAEDASSQAIAALTEERQRLKEEREKRKQEALLPRPTALDRLVRTHHPEAKAKPKAGKDAHDAKDAKKPKARTTRAQKHAEKAAAMEAARNRPKKPAK